MEKAKRTMDTHIEENRITLKGMERRGGVDGVGSCYPTLLRTVSSTVLNQRKFANQMKGIEKVRLVQEYLEGIEKIEGNTDNGNYKQAIEYQKQSRICEQTAYRIEHLSNTKMKDRI